nr:unnamed protein product [Callosobruchus analis]
MIADKNHIVLLKVPDDFDEKSKNHAINKCVLCILITFLLVVNLLVVSRLNSMSQEIETLKIIVGEGLNKVNCPSEEENTKINLAAFEDYQESDSEPTVPTISQENEPHNSTQAIRNQMQRMIHHVTIQYSEDEDRQGAQDLSTCFTTLMKKQRIRPTSERGRTVSNITEVSSTSTWKF